MTLNSVKFDATFAVLPTNRVITLSASDHVLTVGGIAYGDINGDGKVDANETGELNPTAVGLAINDADLALALLTPKDKSDSARYTALRATSDSIRFVGTDVFDFNASNIVIELNLARSNGTDVPVIDFSHLNNNTGYSIDTGSGTPHHQFRQPAHPRLGRRRARQRLEFVYLTGNFALDMAASSPSRSTPVFRAISAIWPVGR